MSSRKLKKINSIWNQKAICSTIIEWSPVKLTLSKNVSNQYNNENNRLM